MEQQIQIISTVQSDFLDAFSKRKVTLRLMRYEPLEEFKMKFEREGAVSPNLGETYSYRL